MGYRKGCFRVRRLGRLCSVAVAVSFAAALFGCGGDSGSDAGYDYEVVGESSAGFTVPDFSSSSEGLPVSSGTELASLSSAAPGSSAVAPQSSSAMEPPRSSAIEPPHSSDSRPPLSSSALRKPAMSRAR